MTIGGFRLAFSIPTGIVPKPVKTRRTKIIMLARSKLSSMGNKICEAVLHHEIRHEDFMTIIDNIEKLISRTKRKYQNGEYRKN